MSRVSTLQAQGGGWRSLLPLTLPLVFVAIVLMFAWQAPGFLSGGNLKSLVLNNFVLLAIVAIGMTYAVAAGGIDLSVGTALISPVSALWCC